MSTALSKRKPSYWIHMIITIGLMFFFGFIPAPEPITAYGMKILGIFLGLVWGWSFCDLAWPSLIAMMALGLTDFGITSAVFEASFGQANLILILFSFLIFAPLTDSGLSQWLGMKLVTIKFIQGKPLKMIAVIYFGTFILCLFVNAIVVGIFMMQLFVGIFKDLGYQKGDQFIPMFLAGLFMCTGLANLLLPFKGMPLMIFGMVAGNGILVSNNAYLVFALLVCALLIIAYILAVKILRLNIALLKNADFSGFEKRLEAPLTPYQSMLLKVIIGFLIGIIFVGVLGSASGNTFRVILNDIGVYGVYVATLALMIIIHVENKPLLDLKTAANGVVWEFILLYAVAMLISSLLTDQSTGISAYVVRFITPILSGLGIYGFLLLLAFVTLILTNVGNNVVVIFTMVSVVSMMVGQGLPINGALAVSVVLWTGLVTGYLTPAASVSAAMIFGCELSTSKSAILQGVIMMLYWMLCLAIFIIPLGMLLL